MTLSLGLDDLAVFLCMIERTTFGMSVNVVKGCRRNQWVGHGMSVVSGGPARVGRSADGDCHGAGAL
jgi:hypothetical protein